MTGPPSIAGGPLNPRLGDTHDLLPIHYLDGRDRLAAVAVRVLLRWVPVLHALKPRHGQVPPVRERLCHRQGLRGITDQH